MTKKQLREIALDALNESELKSSDIPNIDLYVDQILSIVSAKLAEGSPRYYDKQLTKTMINNYSKEGLITPLKGKKYTKEQILQILGIYTLKSTLSISEIKRMFLGLNSSEDFEDSDIYAIYDKHVNIKEKSREYALATLERIVDDSGFDTENDCDYVSVIAALSALSAQLRHIAEAMIEEKFPEPVEPEDEKDKEKEEKKEEKKKEKEEKKEEKKKGKEEKREEKKNKEKENSLSDSQEV